MNKYPMFKLTASFNSSSNSPEPLQSPCQYLDPRASVDIMYSNFVILKLVVAVEVLRENGRNSTSKLLPFPLHPRPNFFHFLAELRPMSTRKNLT